MNEVDIDTKNFLSNLVQSFSPGLRYVCAYGSGVFKQTGHASIKENMIDLIFVVNDAFTWHQQNLTKYPNHYSFLKKFPSLSISNIQKNYGASVYYNTRIDFDDRMIKYGVIEQQDFLNDLYNWESLYIAGRLHKPVYNLKGLDNPLLSNAINTNLTYAVETALLMSPEKTSLTNFFMLISSLSYTGDLRMVIGEDKGKIKNIVEPNIDKFKDLYHSVLISNPNIHIGNDFIEQNIQDDVQHVYIQQLPIKLRQLVMPEMENESAKIEMTMKLLQDRTNLKQVILNGVSNIVKTSSTTQSVKGVLTAGVTKTVLYSAEKLRKMMKGLIR